MSNNGITMSIAPQTQLAISQGEQLLNSITQSLDLPGAPALRQRLERALRQAASHTPDRPITIALIGGTGAGKSQLFNALIRMPNASPVSHAERAFTKKPHIAAHPGDLPAIPLPPELHWVPIHTNTGGIALIDTPDLDGALPENRRQAHLAIQAADIVIYVALPEKRSSFALTEEVKTWSSEKQWFFVLNKIDLCQPSEIGAIRADFERRIRDLGFDTSDAFVFLISATASDSPHSEYHRLRSAIFSARAREEVRSLHEAGVFRLLAGATSSTSLEPLTALSEALRQAEAELSMAVRDVYMRVLSTRAVRDNLTEAVRSRVWRQVPARVGGFLAWPLWIMSRLNQVWLTVSLSRMAAGKISMAHLLQTVWLTAVAYIRGVLPLQGLIAGFKSEDVAQLRSIRQDSVRKLEDLGVAWNDPVLAAKPAPAPTEDQRPEKGMVNWLENIQPAAGLDQEKQQIFATLTSAIEFSSAESAARAIHWWHRLFGNLLPLIVLVDVGRKSIMYWLENAWLPGDFYLLAIFLLILSTFPGCMLVGAAVRARARIGAPDELLRGLEDPWETKPLRETACRVEELIKKTSFFHRQVQEQIRALAPDLVPGRFGAQLEARRDL